MKHACTNVRTLIGALLLAFSCTVHAYWIGLAPTTSVQSVNGTFSIDLVVSGLATDGFILSTFDVDVNFDVSLLQYLGASSGGGLGAGSLFAATAGSGLVNLFELSFLADAELLAAQSDYFTLATMSFTALAPGLTTLDPSFLALGGAQVAGPGGLPVTQNLLDLTHTVGSASVTINPATVPEPGSLLLMLTALALVPLARGQRRRL